jgi:hypothetical protein
VDGKVESKRACVTHPIDTLYIKKRLHITREERETDFVNGSEHPRDIKMQGV